MPNGKPGDHPLTDLLVHGTSEFGPQIDTVVRELAALPRFEEVRARVAELLLSQSVTRDLSGLHSELTAIRDMIEDR